MALGDYIKKERHKRKLNLRQLAMYANVSHSYLSQVEANKFTPHPDWLKKISKALKIDPHILMKQAGFISKKETEEPWWRTEIVAERLGPDQVIKFPVGPRTVLPIIGFAPANNPKEAFETSVGDTPYIKGSDFLVQVKGDSLIEAGILDKDICYIKKQSFAKNGDLVLALLDNEVILRFFYKKGSTIKLKPANNKYKPIVTKKIEIIGVKIAILRH